MKKTYLKIRCLDQDRKNKTVSVFLLTDNITSYIFEGDQTRIYFKNSNPFTFIRIYLTSDDFEWMCKIPEKGNIAAKEVIQEGTTFIYEVYNSL